MSEHFTSKTASLKATLADVRVISAKKIKIDGNDVVSKAKHTKDTRETITENDLWGQRIELKNGELILHDEEIKVPLNWCPEAVIFDQNMALDKDRNVLAYVQTDTIKNGIGAFRGHQNMFAFGSSLDSLVNGTYMFKDCKNLETIGPRSETLEDNTLRNLVVGSGMFSGCEKIEELFADTPNLKYGNNMFSGCTALKRVAQDFPSLLISMEMYKDCISLKEFVMEMPSLVYSWNMFEGCTALKSFKSRLDTLTNSKYMFLNCAALESVDIANNNLPSLTESTSMFENCSSLSEFVTDMCELKIGKAMFKNCSNLSSFTSSLPSLYNGNEMFLGCKLDLDSLMYIAYSINNVRGLKGDEERDMDFRLHLGIDNKISFKEDVRDFLLEIEQRGWEIYLNDTKFVDYATLNVIEMPDFKNANESDVTLARSASKLVNNVLYDANGEVIGALDTSKIEIGGFKDDSEVLCPWPFEDGLFCNYDGVEDEFRGTDNIIEFNSDLSSLTDGTAMFADCHNLITFNTDLSSLTNSDGMFARCGLKSFNVDLSSLVNGKRMFIKCGELTSFDSDLSSLTNATMMFEECYKLTSFNSKLSSLTNGDSMFYDSKLDAKSVANIINTINIVSYGDLSLGVGCDNNDADKDLFAQEAGFSDMNALMKALEDKGWNVKYRFNGR